MTKALCRATALLAAAAAGAMLAGPRPAAGQDMPLREFVPAGDGWKFLGAGKRPAPAFKLHGFATFGGFGGFGGCNGCFNGFGGVPRFGTGIGGFGGTPAPLGFGGFHGYRTGTVAALDGVPTGYSFDLAGQTYAIHAPPFNAPAAAVLTPDGTTLYVGLTKPDTHLWVYPAGRPGVSPTGHRYAQLRTPAGRGTTVSSLTADESGRVYAATPEGVQVFDPTGRLCGVLAPPAKGTIDLLAWDGPKRDRLTVWVGDLKYTRPMSTTGTK
jgi:hypothetical protein